MTSYIGLYEVIERQCKVPQDYFNDCEKTKFIELVRGQFYGIKNDELALVMWRGEKGEDLLYQARKIEQADKVNHLSSEILISADENSSELIKLVGGLPNEYNYSVTNKNASKDKPHSIHYSLKPVERSLIPEYRMNYPGND